MFSKRSAFDFEPNQLAECLAAARKAGKPLLDLTASNPTNVALPFDAAEILSAMSDARALEYAPEALGLLSAREAVSAYYASLGIEISPERVALTASTSEAYAYAFKLFCDPGDEVLIPAPSYPLFEHLATFEAVNVRTYPLRYDGSWHVDLDALRTLRTARTRAIVVVTPNNPTGSYLKRDELAALAELGLPIISDEVFADYALCDDARRARSALETKHVLVLALNGLSKLAALPQLKLGWIALGGPKKNVQEARARLELLADTFLSVNTPVQLALPRLLGARSLTISALRARNTNNLKQLKALTAGSAVTPLHVEGGWYAVLRLPHVHSESAWVLNLLEHDNVVVQPGWFYDFAEEPFVIVSLLTLESTFELGIRRLVQRAEAMCSGA
jgi:aspartate/methionine/tyrosine aminotransferase